MANSRIVRHALFTYRDEQGLERTALRGQTVELTDDELERAERLEAVAAEDDTDVLAASPVVAPLTPDEVLAAGAQADDAGSDEQVGETTETVTDPTVDGGTAKPSTRRSRSSG